MSFRSVNRGRDKDATTARRALSEVSAEWGMGRAPVARPSPAEDYRSGPRRSRSARGARERVNGFRVIHSSFSPFSFMNAPMTVTVRANRVSVLRRAKFTTMINRLRGEPSEKPDARDRLAPYSGCYVVDRRVSRSSLDSQCHQRIYVRTSRV